MDAILSNWWFLERFSVEFRTDVLPEDSGNFSRFHFSTTELLFSQGGNEYSQYDKFYSEKDIKC